MATFKAVVFMRDKKKDGTVNIKIRVTHNRKTRYIATPFFVTQDQLTRTGKLKDAYIEDKVNAKIAELKQRHDQIGFAMENIDIDKLIVLLKDTSGEIDYISFAKKKIRDIEREEGRAATALRYYSVLKSLIEFNGSEVLYFSKMTKAYISQYYSFLLSKKKLSVRTANSYISMLSSLYNKARRELNDEELDIIVVKYSGFQQLEKKTPEDHSYQSFDSVEEMQRFLDTPYYGTRAYDYIKDMFVFSFVCFGMNLKDIQNLKKSQYKDGIITFRRMKVEHKMGARAEMQVQVCDVAKAIINKYKGNDQFLIQCSYNRAFTSNCNMIQKNFQLAGLRNGLDDDEHHYTFNSARHSMATFLINVCRVDKSVVHQMMIHSNSDKMAITDWYIKRDFSIFWEANDKLLALFDWSNFLRALEQTSPCPIQRKRAEKIHFIDSN